MRKSYSDVLSFESFEDRYNYLSIGGKVGVESFGKGLRELNQEFYSSIEWKEVREYVVVRDGGYNLAVVNYHIYGSPVVHHINPVTITDLMDFPERLLDPENLITVSIPTHKAIHYGLPLINRGLTIRKPNDTVLWRIDNDT